MGSSWSELHNRDIATRRKLTEAGFAAIKPAGSKLHVAVPYSVDWPHKARELEGIWKSRSHLWSFPHTRLLDVLNAIANEFGPAALTEKWTKIRHEEQQAEYRRMEARIKAAIEEV